MNTLDVWKKYKIRIQEMIKDMDFKKRLDKKKLSIIGITFIVAVAGFMFYNSGFGHQVNLNGENIGYIKDLSIVDEASEIVEMDTKNTYGDQAFFKSDILTEKVRVQKKDIIKTEALAENMKANIQVMKPATIVKIDGEETLIMESKYMAEALLEEAKKPYLNEDTDENIEVIEIYIEEDIELVDKDILVDNILSWEEAKLILGINKEENDLKLASREKAIGKVSRALGSRRKQETISELSEDEKEPVNSGLLNIIRIEKHTSIKEIDYKEEEVKDSSIYKGQKKVKETGKKGKNEIITEIIYSNGIEESKEILNERVVEEPVNKVTLIGTKNRPQPKAAPTYNGELGSAIVSTARHYLGTPYRSGGSSPSGFDCSGLTSYVYKQYGIYLPRTSNGQLAYGGRISKGELRPGDLVFFTGHVGIYIGNGNMIHAPVPGKRVEIISIHGPYFASRYKGATRPY